MTTHEPLRTRPLRKVLPSIDPHSIDRVATLANVLNTAVIDFSDGDAVRVEARPDIDRLRSAGAATASTTMNAWLRFQSACGDCAIRFERIGGRHVAPLIASDDGARALAHAAQIEPFIVLLEDLFAAELLPAALVETDGAHGPACDAPHACRLRLLSEDGDAVHEFCLAVSETLMDALRLERANNPQVRAAERAAQNAFRTAVDIAFEGPTLTPREIASFEPGGMLLAPTSPDGACVAALTPHAPFASLKADIRIRFAGLADRQTIEEGSPMSETEAVSLDIKPAGQPVYLDGGAPSHRPGASPNTGSGDIAESETTTDLSPNALDTDNQPATLTVETEIVVSGGVLSLDEIATLKAGAILNLPDTGASLPVSVRAGASIIAVGELVALGDTIAVLINETPLNPASRPEKPEDH